LGSSARWHIAVISLIVAFFAVPFRIGAQQERIYRIGVVHQGGSYDQAIAGLQDGLKELGFDLGKHYLLHLRDVRGDLKAVDSAARSLEAERVDLICAFATSTTLRVKAIDEERPDRVLRRDRSGQSRPGRELPEAGRPAHRRLQPDHGPDGKASRAPEGDGSAVAARRDVLQPGQSLGPPVRW
jgi:hypothetical protein